MLADPILDPVPLTVLALELPEPPAGWRAELARRGITTVVDAIGRTCLVPSDAKTLITEHREAEARKARQAREAEQRAIEADQRMRASIWKGIPASAIPDGVSPVVAMTEAARQEGRQRRQTVLEHSLEHPAGALVFHSLSPGDES